MRAVPALYVALLVVVRHASPEPEYSKRILGMQAVRRVAEAVPADRIARAATAASERRRKLCATPTPIHRPLPSTQRCAGRSQPPVRKTCQESSGALLYLPLSRACSIS